MNIQAWLKAARLPSQTYIAFPLLFGQMIYLVQWGQLDILMIVLVQAFGLLDQFYIVFANDYSDWETDQKNDTYNMFSGGSRVLVDGELNRGQLGAAAWITSLGAIGITGLISYLNGTWIALILGVVGVLLLWGYSFKPFLLSYRGGGEFLQMAGVGGVLPLLGYVAQNGGSLEGFPWLLLAVTLPISLACGITTSLPDRPSDLGSSKNTSAVLLGQKGAQSLALILFASSVAAWIVLFGGVFSALTVWIPAGIAIFFFAVAVLDWGGKAGEGKLNNFVTKVVAGNVLFFLAGSIVLGIVG
jgi:1,4-dihydroxy-2-naphthoate octaprenyltransferase